MSFFLIQFEKHLSKVTLKNNFRQPLQKYPLQRLIATNVNTLLGSHSTVALSKYVPKF